MSSVHAGDHPIAEAEVGERRREPIENQQLLLGEDGHNGTRPDWTDRRAGQRSSMRWKHQDGQVAQGPMRTIERD
jgi:hypothetical protein